jgi:metal-responsive CopG/Arc/MetJ family transcriptional regulator
MSNAKKASKSTRVLISLPEKFLSDIDMLADEEQRSRSELIREALRNYIREHEPEGRSSHLLD